jgi:hypothetical protein
MIQENETVYSHDPVILKENIAATKRFFETREGKKIYAKLYDEIFQGDVTLKAQGHAERKIYAKFLDINVNRARVGLRLLAIDIPELVQEAKNVSHAQAMKP